MSQVHTKKQSFFVRLKTNASRHPLVYIMLAIVMVYFILFCYWPMYGNIIAFQNYKPVRGILRSSFVGLKNFQKFFSNFYFYRLLRNTLMISGLNLLFGFPFPIVFAILLNEVRNQKCKKIVQTITYLPHFITTVVICSMITQFTNSTGFITAMVNSMGVHEGSLIGDPSSFRSIYVVSDIWQSFGWNSIIYIAAISGINTDLYEAAAIDGANRAQRMWHVTVPGIRETIVIMLIMACGRLMNVGWEKAFLLQSEATYETSDIISTFVYRKGFVENDYSYSAAVNIFNSVINLILLTVANKVCNKLSGSGLW